MVRVAHHERNLPFKTFKPLRTKAVQDSRTHKLGGTFERFGIAVKSFVIRFLLLPRRDLTTKDLTRFPLSSVVSLFQAVISSQLIYESALIQLFDQRGIGKTRGVFF